MRSDVRHVREETDERNRGVTGLHWDCLQPVPVLVNDIAGDERNKESVRVVAAVIRPESSKPDDEIPKLVNKCDANSYRRNEYRRFDHRIPPRCGGRFEFGGYLRFRNLFSLDQRSAIHPAVLIERHGDQLSAPVHCGYKSTYEPQATSHRRSRAAFVAFP